MSTPEKPDTSIEIQKIAAYLKTLEKLNDQEATQLLKVEKEVTRLLPPKKKVMKIHTVYR